MQAGCVCVHSTTYTFESSLYELVSRLLLDSYGYRYRMPVAKQFHRHHDSHKK